MSHRFVRCPHCKMPHDAAERVCPTTGRRIEPLSGASGARPRMSERPPPERRPEPLGFDHAKNRIAERDAAARAEEIQRPATGTLNPTRNLQTDLIGRTVSDRYLVKGVLGEGGMGTVYEAEHLGLGRPVAIKVLNPSQAKKRVAVKRFQQEARAAGAIGHPNICEVYDLGLLDDGSPYLVMEKLIGTTLADRILRDGGLPFDEIADVMIQVLSGLIAAHDKGIVHRDIKPENIFLARRAGCPPIAKILDFGVSKMMPQFQGGDEQLDLTRTGMVMGTPYYMSPEQARGERNLDGRVDVYACGVMMYEAIAGKRPFLAPNYNALLLSIINTLPRSLRDVRPSTPPALDAIVLRAMAKARDDRYPSANAVLRDIQGLSVGRPAPNHRVPLPPNAEERMRAQALGGRLGMRDPRDEAAERDRGTRDVRAQRGPQTGEGAGATLRSRMAEAQPVPQPRETATRLDIRVGDVRDARAPRDPRDTRDPRDARAPRDARDPRRPPDQEDSGSIEIPIHITGSDLLPVSGGGHGPGEGDEMPTEIFRPGMHPYPAPPKVSSRSPSATRVAPVQVPVVRRATLPLQPQPQPRSAEPLPAAQRSPSVPPPSLPTAMAPVNFSDLATDDWDGETVVKKPAALTTSRHRERTPREGRDSRAGRDNREPVRAVPVAPVPKPFNPDDTTISANGEFDVEVDFGDDTHQNSPPRRR